MKLVWQLIAIAAVSFVGGRAVYAVEGNPWLSLAVGVLVAALAIPVYRWVVRRTERREVTELAWDGAGATTGLGALTGVAMFGFVIADIYFLGHYHVDGLGTPSGAVGLFSTEVSGNGTPQGLLDASTSGPTLVSGGDFGPEASAYTVLAGTLLTIAFLWLAKRRGNLVPVRRRAARTDSTAALAR